MGRPLAGLLVHNKEADVLCLPSSRNIVTAEISIKGVTFIAISVYFPPSSDMATNLLELSQVLDSHSGKNIIIGGDFNAKSPMWHSSIADARGDAVANFLCTRNLYVLNEPDNAPTFENHMGSSNIDISVTNCPLFYRVNSWDVLDGVGESSDSDHRYIEFSFLFGTPPPPDLIDKRYNMKLANWDNFRSALAREAPFRNLTDQMTTLEVDLVVQNLEEAITVAADLSIPRLKPRDIARPWWTDTIREMRESLKKLKKRRNRTRRHEFRRLELQAALNRLDTAYKRLIDKEKTGSFRKYCSRVDTANPFSGAYKLISGKQKSVKPLHSLVKEDGTTTNSLLETVDCLLSSFFPFDDPSTDTPDQAHKRLAMRSLPDTPDDLLFSLGEVRSAIYSMDTDKSPGEDLITALMVQVSFEMYSQQFTTLYNRCLELGHFPAQWKSALVRVIPKPGKKDLSLIKAHRPICLLSVLGKVLDKLMIRRITWFLKTQNCLSARQYGFTPQTSTEDAIFDLVDEIRSRRNSVNYTALVSNDISGAFDHAWWPEIFFRLREFAVPRNLVRLALSYFSDRKARLVMHNVSSERHVTMGCPQGSSSGPGFWNILINSLLTIDFPPYIHQQAFADDTAALVSSGNFSKIPSLVSDYLTRVSTWGASVKLTFNPAKTNILIFPELFWNGGRWCSRSLPIGCGRIFRMNGVRIEPVHEIKLLGVVIDDKLSWTPHITQFSARLKSFFHGMRRVARTTWGLSQPAQYIIYRAVFEPIAGYCASVYVDALSVPTKANLLASAQHTALTQITAAYRDTSVDALPVLAGVIPIKLFIEERASLFHLTRGRTISQISLPPLSLREPYFSGPHPDLRHSFEVDRTSALPPATHAIYTDGSKTASAVGSAFAVFTGSTLAFKNQFLLSQACSVFQAELFAILQATLFIARNRMHHVAIITDSESALMALQSYNPTHPLARRILAALPHDNVRLQWTRSHAGTHGNVVADKLAATADSATTNISFEAFSINSARTLLRKASLDTWNSLWNQSSKGRYLFAFLPDVRERMKLGRFTTSFLSRLLTGHGNFNNHFFRMHRRTTGTCRCGEAPDTPAHLIKSCAILSDFRRELYERLGHWPTSLADFMTPDGTLALSDFAKSLWRKFRTMEPSCPARTPSSVATHDPP